MGLKKPSPTEPLREVVTRAQPRDLPGLLAQLRSAQAEDRRWAARDLAEHASAATALGEALLSERDARVREALFISLTALASDKAVAGLLPLLRSEDAALRNGAIEALSSMPQAVAPRISALLHDSDPDVRIFTVNLLGDLRHAQVLPWLLLVLAQDTEVNVVAAALEVLAEVGQPQHVPALVAVRQRFADDPFIGFSVEMATQRMEAP